MDCVREDGAACSGTGRMMGIRNRGTRTRLCTWRLTKTAGPPEEPLVRQTSVLATEWAPINCSIQNGKHYKLEIVSEE